jgi:hypothetical protein
MVIFLDMLLPFVILYPYVLPIVIVHLASISMVAT